MLDPIALYKREIGKENVGTAERKNSDYKRMKK